jgi:iron complex outermembrane receptor protein
MSLVQTQNQGTSFITVRGISQARNSEPSVAVLIDGVQMANPSQFNQELFDIDSIQVLKGPQARSTDGMPSAARFSSTRKSRAMCSKAT